MSWSAVRAVIDGDGEGEGADTVGVGNGEDPLRFGTSLTGGAPAPMTTRTPGAAAAASSRSVAPSNAAATVRAASFWPGPYSTTTPAGRSAVLLVVGVGKPCTSSA